MAYEDGWKAEGEVLVCGPDVDAQGRASSADIFWRKLGTEFEETHTALVGAGSIWPDSLGRYEPNEILLRFGVSRPRPGQAARTSARPCPP